MLDKTDRADPRYERAAAEATAPRPDATEIEPPRPGFRLNRKLLRPALLIAGPVLVAIVAGYFYLTSGRYVSTDNAYVHADKITVNPEVSGPIATVAVVENQHVEPGQVLFRVDEAPFKVALARADAQVSAAVTHVEALKAQYRSKQSEIALAQSSLDFADRELARQRPLAARAIASQATLDQAQYNADQARAKLDVADRDLEQIRAQLGGDPNIATNAHPQVQAAVAQRDAAALDLAHTAIKAAFAGIASKVPRPGQYVTTGAPAMSLVADKDLWIEANFKETEITKMKAGQPASITVDTYPGVTWTGHVASLAQATGAEFSVLPAQNATGNWVKVVQRIPVRIAIDVKPGQPQLRSGMSADVTIDTKAAATAQPLAPAPATPAVAAHDAEPLAH